MKCNPWVGGSIGRRGFPMLGTGKRGLSTTIKEIFRNGEQGFAYDPNDLTTMWQDQAKLLPVTGEGQPVWHILDKSGNNNHAFATSSATRPILQRNVTTGAYYLAFDGSDDFFVTNSINFTGTDKVTVIAGVRKLADAAQIVVELSANGNTNASSFDLVAGTNINVTGYTSGARGAIGSHPSQVARNFTYLAPDTAVLSAKHDISGKLSSMRRNGVVGIDGTGTKGTGNFGNYPLYIGRRGGTSFPFNGQIYGLIGVGRLTTDDETAAIEKELAKRVGVTLNV